MDAGRQPAGNGEPDIRQNTHRLGWRPDSLTKNSRNRVGQFVELQGRTEYKEKHLPIICPHSQRGLLLELTFGIWFKLKRPTEERNP